MHPAVR